MDVSAAARVTNGAATRTGVDDAMAHRGYGGAVSAWWRWSRCHPPKHEQKNEGRVAANERAALGPPAACSVRDEPRVHAWNREAAGAAAATAAEHHDRDVRSQSSKKERGVAREVGSCRCAQIDDRNLGSFEETTIPVLADFDLLPVRRRLPSL